MNRKGRDAALSVLSDGNAQAAMMVTDLVLR